MKPQQYQIQELVHKALIGDLVLPDIQRDFVWNTDRITELLDSLMREFPFGSLLFWETRFHEVQYRNFERDYQSGMRFTTKEKSLNEPKVMVLDGQQRLQSLIIALVGSFDGKKCYFDLLSGPSDTISEVEELPDGFDFRFLSDEQYKAESKFPENRLPAHIWIPVSQVMSWEQRNLVKLAKDFCEKNRIPIDSEEGSLITENVQRLYYVVWGAARVTAVTVDESCYEPSMA